MLNPPDPNSIVARCAQCDEPLKLITVLNKDVGFHPLEMYQGRMKTFFCDNVCVGNYLELNPWGYCAWDACKKPLGTEWTVCDETSFCSPECVKRYENARSKKPFIADSDFFTAAFVVPFKRYGADIVTEVSLNG